MKKLCFKLWCVSLAMGISLLPSAVAQSNDSFDLNRTSGFLSDRGVYTLVPKSAVVHVPKGMEVKLQRVEGSRYVSFEQFMRRNCVWVQRMPISVSQATGQVSVDSVRIERMKKLGKVVIAVHKGSPISFHQPTVELLAKVE